MDLRSFLSTYKQSFPQDVWRISDPVSIEYEITAYVLELERQGRSPLLIFDKLTGFDGAMVTNMFGSRERIARMLGTDVDHLHDTWVERTDELTPPVWVDEGPVHEVEITGDDVDLRRFPIPTHFSGDGGPYITSGVCVARDPDTGVANLSFARMQLKGSNRLGISIHSRGHLWDYFRRAEASGMSLELAVVIGAHPTVLLGSGSRAPIEVDEYEIAGSLAGAPVELVRCRTIDVGVPANAELVIEGEIVAGEREDEGPFGEYPGYSTYRSTRNVVEVRAITHRKDPVYFNVTPGFCSEHLLLDRIQKEATMRDKLRAVIPDVTAVYYPKSGTLFHCYVSLDKKLEGQPEQVGLLLLGLDHYVKLVIVVDDDIDVTNEEEVLWAVATRFQAKDDAVIVPRSLTNVLDPSSEGGVSSKMMLDATAPLEWDAERVELPDEVVSRVRSAIELKTEQGL